jgi:lipopolysaccharide/colanic/teichoic acid biosynthesis glycosyltransferase
MVPAKRVFDLVIASVGVVLLLPVYAVIALLVWVDLGLPVIFHQQRPGYKGRPFTLYKFRSMQAGTGGDEARLSAFGRFLRSTSLDELPELFNILKGEMSLVGPRPLLMEYLPLYSAEQMRRHDMLPGLTGWAQVNGRNDITWPERFALDVWYTEHWSFWLDLKIILMSVWKVITRQGVTQEGRATVDYFKGNDPP